MKRKVYLKPLKKYLSEEISPKELARLLDELTHDYFQKIILLDLKADSGSYIHEEASDFFYHLKMLRDVLRKCKA